MSPLFHRYGSFLGWFPKKGVVAFFYGSDNFKTRSYMNHGDFWNLGPTGTAEFLLHEVMHDPRWQPSQLQKIEYGKDTFWHKIGIGSIPFIPPAGFGHSVIKDYFAGGMETKGTTNFQKLLDFLQYTKLKNGNSLLDTILKRIGPEVKEKIVE